MGSTTVRTSAIVAVALGFLAVVISTAFDWPLQQWIVLIGWALLAIGVVVGAVRMLKGRMRERRGGASQLSASDDFSDLELGRRPITHYPRDEASTSQIGDPPPEHESNL